MGVLGILAVGAVALFGKYVACEILHITGTKEAALEEARRLSNGRGIINLGCGPHRTPQSQVIAEAPEVLANVDIAPDGMPHFIQIDIEKERLPFGDQQFGACLLSHVLEHLDNWEFALGEALRVADYVVVVLPHPSYISGWINPDHRQHFSVEDIEEMAQTYPNVEVYY